MKTLRLVALVFFAAPTAAIGADEAGAPPRRSEPGPPLNRIAFGSCATQERPQPIWDAVVASRPELFMFLGDNIYADTVDMNVMRAKYAKLAAMPGYRRLRKACPVLAIWDDHDLGLNNAGGDYPHKVESQKIFLDFFDEPAGSPRRSRPGVYDAHVYGPPGKRVQIILLDTRYFRSPLKEGPPGPKGNRPLVPNTDPKATVLGEGQWRWFAEQLRAPAELRLIVSGIQVVNDESHGEKWANFPRERQRLFDLIRTSGAEGVVFLTGDRHLGELSTMHGSAGYPFFDLTSSGLNQGSKAYRPYGKNRHRVSTMNWGDNFGMVAIDWGRDDLEIGLKLLDVHGDVFLHQKLNLSVLRRPAPKTGAKPSK